jgi:uncharacterized Zn-binding protein involved in type VI secretion
MNPTNIKETFEFGRNSSENQQKASGKEASERPTIWSDLSKDRSDKSLTGAITSLASDVAVGLGANLKITLENLAYQINPLRGFSNIADGISTDLRNMRTELGIKTQTLNVGDDRKFVNIDGKGNQIGSAFTFEEYLKDPTLASNKLFSNGIMNNFNDAQKNALSQLGTPDVNGKITILFDPTAAPDAKFADAPIENIRGLLSDLGEVSVNYLGANVLGGAIQTKGQAIDQAFISAVANNAKDNGNTIILAGHSGGGLRNYLTLANSSQGQYLDSNGNSVLITKFAGTPANAFDINQAAANAGITNNYIQNNPGDFVGNFLGANGDVGDAASSLGHLIHLFEPKIPFTDIKLQSPHSIYRCIGIGCNSNTNLNFNLKQNSPLAPLKAINLNSDQ